MTTKWQWHFLWKHWICFGPFTILNKRFSLQGGWNWI